MLSDVMTIRHDTLPRQLELVTRGVITEYEIQWEAQCKHIYCHLSWARDRRWWRRWNGLAVGVGG